MILHIPLRRSGVWIFYNLHWTLNPVFRKLVWQPVCSNPSSEINSSKTVRVFFATVIAVHADLIPMNWPLIDVISEQGKLVINLAVFFNVVQMKKDFTTDHYVHRVAVCVYCWMVPSPTQLPPPLKAALFFRVFVKHQNHGRAVVSWWNITIGYYLCSQHRYASVYCRPPVLLITRQQTNAHPFTNLAIVWNV